jgi:D-alanyl-D-alanine carboxypeptidase (penicillin-binding protein 5/6)
MIAPALAALLAVGAAQAQTDAYPKAAKAYVVEVDGRVLWAGRAEQPRQPASLAKMMTALLVLEAGDLDGAVAVSVDAARETGTRLGLRARERFSRRDLLTAAVVRSANDACRALADDAGGEKSFTARMNERAAALGMKATVFKNACGHDAPGQRTTASDLVRLARAVEQRPEYMKAAGLARAEIRSLDGRALSFENTNALIGRYEGALGLKTGTTPQAGTCLAALAQRKGRRVLVIMLAARDRWWGADSLLDRAFAATAP